MNAQEARRLSDKNKGRHSRIPYIDSRIAEAAHAGRYSILLHECLSNEDTLVLTIMGYKVAYEPDPDPGHPCNGPQTTITW